MRATQAAVSEVEWEVLAYAGRPSDSDAGARPVLRPWETGALPPDKPPKPLDGFLRPPPFADAKDAKVSIAHPSFAFDDI